MIPLPGILSRDTRGFIDDYRLYFSLVHGYIAARVGAGDDALDIAQEVFMRLLEKYHEVEKVRPWLLGTTRNVLREFYRSRGGDLPMDLVEPSGALLFTNGDRELRLIIEEALDMIEERSGKRDRVIFELVALYGYTYAVTARQLGISERRVRHNFARSLRSMTAYLHRKGVRNLEDLA